MASPRYSERAFAAPSEQDRRGAQRISAGSGLWAAASGQHLLLAEARSVQSKEEKASSQYSRFVHKVK
jgi:hypothetical protein